MSRELLKRAVRFMSVVGCSNDDICELCDEIEGYLAQPEPEPVVWTTMPDADDWDFISGSKDPNGKMQGNWQPLYTTPPDQSARVAELKDELLAVWDKYESTGAELCAVKQQLAALTSDGIRHMETITELRNQLVTPNWENNRIAMQVGEIKELKQQLAALQAREPLSDVELRRIWNAEANKLNNTELYSLIPAFARAIEAAHSITRSEK